MSRRRKPRTYPTQTYPTLGAFVCGRRQFLRNLGLGALAVGAGRLLAACESTRGIDGHTEPGELFTVRLPGEGFASTYLSYDEYLRYAVSFTTYNEELAAHFRAAHEETLVTVSGLLAAHSCEEFTGPLGSIEDSIRTRLEELYEELHGETIPMIHSLTLIIDGCEWMPIAGGDREPGYP
jgi:hypothetical protein